MDGLETGVSDSITGIIQQRYSCNIVSVWSESNIIQLINVECLQKDVSDNIP